MASHKPSFRQSKSQVKASVAPTTANDKLKIIDTRTSTKSMKVAGITSLSIKEDLIKWIRSVPLSKKVNFIPRDFMDGLAQIIKHFAPRRIELHNYFTGNSQLIKSHNWTLMNAKVFAKIGLELKAKEIEELISRRYRVNKGPGVQLLPMEKFLLRLQATLGQFNPHVYDYKQAGKPDEAMTSPIVKPRYRLIRPISRQPMSGLMWKVEREEGEKYGMYTGNPIVWDGPIPGIKADSIGLSKAKFEALKYEANNLQFSESQSSMYMDSDDLTDVKVIGDGLPPQPEPLLPVCVNPGSPICVTQRPEMDGNRTQTQSTQVTVSRGTLRSSGFRSQDEEE